MRLRNRVFSSESPQNGLDAITGNTVCEKIAGHNHTANGSSELHESVFGSPESKTETEESEVPLPQTESENIQRLLVVFGITELVPRLMAHPAAAFLGDSLPRDTALVFETGGRCIHVHYLHLLDLGCRGFVRSACLVHIQDAASAGSTFSSEFSGNPALGDSRMKKSIGGLLQRMSLRLKKSNRKAFFRQGLQRLLNLVYTFRRQFGEYPEIQSPGGALLFLDPFVYDNVKLLIDSELELEARGGIGGCVGSHESICEGIRDSADRINSINSGSSPSREDILETLFELGPCLIRVSGAYLELFYETLDSLHLMFPVFQRLREPLLTPSSAKDAKSYFARRGQSEQRFPPVREPSPSPFHVSEITVIVASSTLPFPLFTLS